MHNTKVQGCGVAAAVVALALSSCATAPSRPQTSARADPQLEISASAFEGFMRQARGIDAGFSGPAAVAGALQVAAAYEPKQMEAGMIAYAALAALQEQRFVAGVRQAARAEPGLSRRLASAPEAVASLPGADAAASRANAALERQGAGLSERGRLVKQASYSLQRQGWSKVFVPDPKGRLDRVKRIALAGRRPSGEDHAQLYAALAEGGRGGGGVSPVVARGLALAALSVLGEAGEGRRLMSEPRSGMCVRLAKLNFHQCLASAGPYYEDVYCLGQHAMIDPGQCALDAARPQRIVRR